MWLDNPDDQARLFYLLILGLGILTFFLYGRRHRLGQVLEHLAIWVMIFVMAIIAYGFSGVLKNQLFPSQAVQISEEALRLSRGTDGHFRAQIEINGRPVRFVVDTGATDIVLSRRDARAVGIDLDNLAYTGRAVTANGVVRTASVRLDSVRFGDFVDSDLRASVNEGELGVSLLGMTYLSRFPRIEIAGEHMILYR